MFFLMFIVVNGAYALVAPQVQLHVPKGKIAKKPTPAAKLMPRGVSRRMSFVQLQRKFVDHNVGQFIKKNIEKSKSPVWKAAKQIKKLNQSISFGGNKQDTIKHKFDIDMQAMEQVAQVKYSGYFNARVNYQIPVQRMQLEMSRTVLKSTHVSYRLVKLGDNQLNSIAVKWPW